ncbi:DUF1266 domain-containing protein [Maribacter sp.]|nr:DUF1266 domain-containing protein [Maribacter sp.]
MKRILKVGILVVGAMALLLNLGCSQKSAYSDDTLKGFMLAGVYAVQSYGGDKEVRAMISGSSDADIINDYKNVLVFYFDTSYNKMCSETLSDYWDITDRDSLLATLEELKKSEYEYKAWDYARLANNAALGYCSGYMTKEEVMALLDETLALAQSTYSSWEEYHVDFNRGRKSWNPDAPDLDEFTQLTKAISEGDDAIFTLVPLN